MFKKSAIRLFPVGQCGNQIGCRFWDLALREHAHVNKVSPTQYDTRVCNWLKSINQSVRICYLTTDLLRHVLTVDLTWDYFVYPLQNWIHFYININHSPLQPRKSASCSCFTDVFWFCSSRKVCMMRPSVAFSEMLIQGTYPL